MHPRVQELIELLQLKPHPEGGFYAETFRSVETTTTPQGQRNLMTAIYFLLTHEHVSRFHIIESDELWFHHEGNDLSIHVLDDNGHTTLKLGSESPEARAQHLVPKKKIFGSTVDTPNGYALVSCVVAPGFDFADFRLCSKSELHEMYPRHTAVIEQLGC